MKQFFTFTQDSAYSDYYIEIRAESPRDAREAMNTLYGLHWAFQYDSADKAGVEQYELTRLAKIKVNKSGTILEVKI